MTIRGIVHLNLVQSLGKVDHLVTDGPYAWTRNPQCLGDIVAALGWMAWSGSFSTILVGSGLVVWLILVPLTEEPVPENTFGEPYQEYRQDVPRFVVW